MQQKCVPCFLRSAQSGQFGRGFYATAAWATVCGGSQRWAVRLVTTWTPSCNYWQQKRRESVLGAALPAALTAWPQSVWTSSRFAVTMCTNRTAPHRTNHVDMCVTLKSRREGWLKQKLPHSLIILKGESLVPGVTRDDSHRGSKSEFGVLTLWHAT